jgi:hypothetical protein
MDPVAILNLALIALDGVLSIIARLKGQGGLTDDQILAAAQAQTGANAAQIQQLLANLPSGGSTP